MGTQDNAVAVATPDPQNAATDNHENDDASPGILQTIWRHPMILACCLYANVGSLMYGFDNLSLSLCLSMSPFVEQFGILAGDTYVVPAYWQSLWNALPQLMTGIGAWGAGSLADRFGRRSAFVAAGCLSAAGVAVVYTATTRPVFLGGKMVNALGLGMALTAGQIYIAEIAPIKFRGIALSIYTFTMNLGYLVGASVAFDRVTIMDQSSYKVLFASEWVWPGLMILGVFLVPETPYHLARKGRLEAATKALRFLYGKKTETAPILDMITSTLAHEEQEERLGHDSTSNGKSENSFVACFRGVNARRTRIVLYCNGLPQMIGATFLSNAPYFMISAGMSPTKVAMMIELGIGLAIVGSAFTFATIPHVGRRKIMLGGLILAAILFLIMGIASSVPNQSAATLWCTGVSLQLVWLTMGPIIGPAMAVAGEVSAVRLRAKTASLGFFFNYAFSTVWNVVVPYMYNTDAGNLQGKTGWIFLATCLISLAVVWFEVPELKDLTYDQIDERFALRVGTRAFKTWKDEAPVPRKGADMDVELEEVE